MALHSHISAYAGQLTALFVEDDGPARLVMAARMKHTFKELLLARNGQDGLEAWRAHNPDIILTDHAMPGMTGLEMAGEIRKTGSKTPIIFITSSMDQALLEKVMDLGISAILPKPVVPDVLSQAVSLVVGMLENDQLQRRALEQDMALLHLRERYHEHQQELAFRKELSIQENDFLVRPFNGQDGRGEWIVQVAYRPKDIMCGDSYSLRRLPDGGMLVFLADAMGKGLSAALTTSLAVYTFNLLVDALAPGDAFVLERFAQGFRDRIAPRLLEDEVLPFCIVRLPPRGDLMETAAFGMPPMLLAGGAGSRKVPCNNPPLSPYTEGLRTTVHSLAGIDRLLFHTDGLNEACMPDGGLYRDHLEADFGTRAGLEAFRTSFRARVPEPEDDITCLFLTRIDGPPLWSGRLEVPSRLEAVEAACQELERQMETRTALDPEARYAFNVAMREALLNAYEHGALEIPGALKRELLEEGRFYDHLLEKEATRDLAIAVEVSALSFGKSRLLKVVIQDPGPGFEPSRARFEEADSLMLHGRGLKMIRKYTDAFHFNEKGNIITLLRFCQEASDGHRPHQPE